METGRLGPLQALAMGLGCIGIRGIHGRGGGEAGPAVSGRHPHMSGADR